MNPNKIENEEEKPPAFSSWNKLYFIVFASLAAMILLFYIFTETFK